MQPNIQVPSAASTHVPLPGLKLPSACKLHSTGNSSINGANDLLLVVSYFILYTQEGTQSSEGIQVHHGSAHTAELSHYNHKSSIHYIKSPQLNVFLFHEPSASAITTPKRHNKNNYQTHRKDFLFPVLLQTTTHSVQHRIRHSYFKLLRLINIYNAVLTAALPRSSVPPPEEQKSPRAKGCFSVSGPRRALTCLKVLVMK